MNTRMQTQLKANTPGSTFTPVQSGLLQRKCVYVGNKRLAGMYKDCCDKHISSPHRAYNSTEPACVSSIAPETLRLPGQPRNEAVQTFMLPRDGHDFNNISVYPSTLQIVQPKLKINQPGDKYEQEADCVAEQVMRMPENEATSISKVSEKVQCKCAACASGAGTCSECAEEEKEEEKIQLKPLATTITPLIQRQSEEMKEEDDDDEHEEIQTKPLANPITPLVQRQSEPEEEIEEDEEEENLQAKGAPGHTRAVTPPIAANIHALRGGGQPLPETTRSFFEPRFGADFSEVRVHTDSRAEETARGINARAYTIGQDIVFGTAQYSPGSIAGKKLLAHELTHVVQQTISKKAGRRPEITRRDSKNWTTEIEPAKQGMTNSSLAIQRKVIVPGKDKGKWQTRATPWRIWLRERVEDPSIRKVIWNEILKKMVDSNERHEYKDDDSLYRDLMRRYEEHISHTSSTTAPPGKSSTAPTTTPSSVGKGTTSTAGSPSPGASKTSQSSTTATSPKSGKAPLATPPPGVKTPFMLHRVVSGEILSKLSTRYGVSEDAIFSANKSRYPKMRKDHIEPGWELKIPGWHRVDRGETLSKLSKSYGLSEDAIISANKSRYPKMGKDHIELGWELKIPTTGKPGPSPGGPIGPGVKHYTLKDSTVVLSPEIEKKVNEIANEYYAETGKNIVVTDGDRTPLMQADRMYTNRNFGIYTNKKAADEIQKVYNDGVTARKSKNEIVANMAKVIEAQISNGTYISPHLRVNAADIRMYDMNKGEKEIFKRIAEKWVRVLPEGKPPHWHLSISSTSAGGSTSSDSKKIVLDKKFDFLGVRVEGGLNKTLKDKLSMVERHLQAEYDRLPSSTEPKTFKEWAGIKTIKSWRDECKIVQKKSSKHCSGSAIDINYITQPYIATRTTTKGGKTIYGGEKKGKKLQAERRAAVAVYDRAVAFVHGVGAEADVSARRPDEPTSKVFERFHKTSEALKTYFEFAFKTDEKLVTKKPVVSIETATKVQIQENLQEENVLKDESEALALLEAFMKDSDFKKKHPGWHKTPAEQYLEILRDYEHVRIPMVKGKEVVARPSVTRNPAKGFLDLRPEIVEALVDVGKLRWGASDFGPEESGDVMHFDLGYHAEE